MNDEDDGYELIGEVQVEDDGYEMVGEASSTTEDDGYELVGETQTTSQTTRAQLLGPENLEIIRDHMVRRYGVNYIDKAPEDLVEEYLSNQRILNSANEVAVFNEAMHINRSDDAGRVAAAKAYDLFDSLEPIYNNASAGEVAEAVGDYALGILASPLNLVGFGLGRFVAGAGAHAASQGVKLAARTAARQAMATAAAGGATREATRKTGKEVMDRVVKNAYRDRLIRRAAQTGGAEAGVSMAKEMGLQEGVRRNADPSREVDLGAYAIVGGLGFIGGAVGQIGVDYLGSKHIPAQEYAKLLSKKPTQVERATRGKKIVSDITSSWDEMVKSGGQVLGPNGLLDEGFLRLFVLGDKDKGIDSIADQMWQGGFEIKPELTRWTEQITHFLKNLDPAAKAEYEKVLAPRFRGTPMETLEGFSDTIAASLNKAGSTINVMSLSAQQYGKTAASDAAALLNAGGRLGMTDSQIDEVASNFANWPGYVQNVWKRLLVSNPETTLLNVQGSGAFYTGRQLEDGVSWLTAEVGSRLMSTFGFEATGNLGKSQAYRGIMGDRIRNLFSPTANSAVFKEMMKLKPQQFEQLRRTTALGVSDTVSGEELLKQYGFDKSSSLVKALVGATEKTVNAAQVATLVRAQDGFFKAFGVVDNLNVIARQKYGRSLDDIITSGDFRKTFDNDDFGRAIHETLKGTFSADYTRKNKFSEAAPWLQSTVFETIEKISNTPGMGILIPFGKFANNVLMTTYNYASFVPMFMDMIGRRSAVPTMELWSRGVVSSTMLGLATTMALAKREEGIPWNEVVIEGNRIDVTNNYPMGFIALAGEIGARISNGEKIDNELTEAFAIQTAVIGLMRDVDVYNNTKDLLRDIMNAEPGSEQTAKVLGSFLAGFTRPAQPLNDLFAVFENGGQTPNRRDETGFYDNFSAEATRYVDNIFAAFKDEGAKRTDFDYTREATREGKTYAPGMGGRYLLGLRFDMPRTHAEKLFGMSGIPKWKANAYSSSPKYDRLVNEVIGPMLENQAKVMLKTPRFINGNLTERRAMTEALLGQLQRDIRENIKSGGSKDHQSYDIIRRLAKIKQDRPHIYDNARADEGILEKNPKAMSYEQLILMNQRLTANQDFLRIE